MTLVNGVENNVARYVFLGDEDFPDLGEEVEREMEFIEKKIFYKDSRLVARVNKTNAARQSYIAHYGFKKFNFQSVNYRFALVGHKKSFWRPCLVVED